MTADEQLIAIAEARGWTRCRFIVKGAGAPERKPSPYGFPPGKNYEAPLPNYLNDLNAMHEAEKVLTNSQRRFYVVMLIKVHPLHYDPQSPTHVDDKIAVFLIANMTAAQRAEAFLRTIGRWYD